MNDLSGEYLGPGKIPDELIEFIKTGSKFVIAGHKEPDGDCLGSQLVLQSILHRLGKEAVLCSAGPFRRTGLTGFDESFPLVKYLSDEFLADNFPSSLTPEAKKNAKVIIVDCSSLERTGDLEKELEGLPYAVIDHHAAGKLESSVPCYIDTSSPSCTLLIYKLISFLGLELTHDEANLLLFGLCTDTGFFRHLTEKNADVFEIAAKMVRCGASPKHIFSVMNGGKTLESRILAGRILSRTESFYNGKLLVSYESLEDFKAFGHENRDSDSLIKLMQSVDGVEAIAIIRQESEDTCTVSFRSAEFIDVAKIASSLGGGGHKNASGLTLKGNISNIKKIILKEFSRIFNL